MEKKSKKNVIEKCRKTGFITFSKSINLHKLRNIMLSFVILYFVQVIVVFIVVVGC